MPEDHAFALFLDVEEVHRLAELAVIALLGLLDALDVRLELLFVGPGRAVDALKLRVAMIAAPIGAGELREFERFAEPAR